MMIKLPKEISAALTKLDNEGLDSYIAGSCVMESLAGEEPYYWTIVTSGAKETALEAAAEELKKTGEEQELELTILTGQDPEIWLKKQPFTLYAIASHPQRGFIDPLKGREDMKKKLVRASSDPADLFDSCPEMVLEALCLVSELDFDMELETYKAMQRAAEKVKNLPPAVLRDQFARILTGKAAAKALRMSGGCGALTALLGEDNFPPKSRHEGQQLETLMENLDLSRAEMEYRYALLFLCFDRQRAEKMIERLEFDEEFHQQMIKAVKLLEDLYFSSDRRKFKPFLAKVGRETYEYLHSLSKQQRKVYDLPEFRILSRIYMIKEYEDMKIPVFVEDLAVVAEDLQEIGITDSEEAEDMLRMLLDVVHKEPRKNTREALLKKAKEFRKNPIKAALRGVHWLK